jgi:hypothetical protein
VLQDLTSMMSSFGNGGFTNNVSSNQPLPDAFNSEQGEYNTAATEGNDEARNTSACREDNGDLSKNRIGDLFKLLGELFTTKDPKEMMTKLSDLFKLLSENAHDRQTVQDARTSSQWFAGGSVITA